MADDDLNDNPEDTERERIAQQKAQLDKINRRIDGELRTSRPDRYEPGDKFLDEVIERIADEVPATIACQMLARDLVGRREGEATRRVNRFLKGLAGAGANGQYALPVDWSVYVDEPVAISVPQVEDGETTGYRRERVTLRAVKTQDWLNFARAGRADAQHRFDAEMSMYDAAEWCAAQQGTASFKAWAEHVQPPRREADASA